MSVTRRNHFLSLDEAAERLGVSRLRVREAVAQGILLGAKDNRGHLRVDLGGGFLDRTDGVRADPVQLINALFDEIEELQDKVGDSEALTARLSVLVERQQSLLERLTTDGAYVGEGKSAANIEGLANTANKALLLLERATMNLEDSHDESRRLGGLLDKSLTAAESMEHVLGDRQKLIDRQRGVIERLYELSEQMWRHVSTRREGGGFIDRFFRKPKGQ
ncbi:MAG: hypothetical protein ACYC0C_16660 [Devosia sp.]